MCVHAWAKESVSVWDRLPHRLTWRGAGLRSVSSHHHWHKALSSQPERSGSTWLWKRPTSELLLCSREAEGIHDGGFSAPPCCWHYFNHRWTKVQRASEVRAASSLPAAPRGSVPHSHSSILLLTRGSAWLKQRTPWSPSAPSLAIIFKPKQTHPLFAPQEPDKSRTPTIITVTGWIINTL